MKELRFYTKRDVNGNRFDAIVDTEIGNIGADIQKVVLKFQFGSIKHVKMINKNKKIF